MERYGLCVARICWHRRPVVEWVGRASPKVTRFGVRETNQQTSFRRDKVQSNVLGDSNAGAQDFALVVEVRYIIKRKCHPSPSSSPPPPQSVAKQGLILSLTAMCVAQALADRFNGDVLLAIARAKELLLAEVREQSRNYGASKVKKVIALLAGMRNLAFLVAMVTRVTPAGTKITMPIGAGC